MAALFAYTWGGYWLLLWLLARWRPMRWETRAITPPVTILVTVHNEAHTIRQRLENLLDADYPREFYEIVVASDGSTDATEAIVHAMSMTANIRLISLPRQGKSAAQNQAIPQCRGEIIVLTDAGTRFERTTVKNIVCYFADARIGCVTGCVKLRPHIYSGISTGHQRYWRAEQRLRMLESRLGLLHTCSGQVMAFRRSLFTPFPAHVDEDGIIPLDILRQGYRVVQASNAIAYDTFPSTLRGELTARVRMTLRNWPCTVSALRVLTPVRAPGMALAICSHKILRWLTPYILCAIFLVNMLLIRDSGFYAIIWTVQVACYLLGGLGLLLEWKQIHGMGISMLSSVLLANIGFGLGVLRSLMGHRIVWYQNEDTT